MQIEVINIGSKVKLNSGVDGVINAVCMRKATNGYYVTYSIEWWTSSSTKNEEWFAEHQFDILIGSTSKVGFLN